MRRGFGYEAVVGDSNQLARLVGSAPNLEAGVESIFHRNSLAGFVHIVDLQVFVVDEFEAQVEAIDYRPLAPGSRHDKADVFAVVGSSVKEGDAEAVVAPERWVRDGDRIALGQLVFKKIRFGDAGVLWLDVDAEDSGSSGFLGSFNECSCAAGRFKHGSGFEVWYAPGHNLDKPFGQIGWRIELFFACDSGVAEFRLF